MQPALPPLAALRSFLAAARHLSFKRAADELCITPSAVSHQIRTLEEYAGVPLFRRGIREVALTREGEIYVADLSRSMEAIADATARLRSGAIAGPLAVRCSPGFAARWLIPRLGSLRRRHPDIEIHLSTSVETANFSHDGIDVDIRWNQAPAAGLQVDALLASSRYPVASPLLLYSGGKPRMSEDLCHFRLLHDESTEDWGRWFALAGMREPTKCREGPWFAHCGLLLDAAAEGQGAAMAYDVLVEGDLASGRLVRLSDIELPPAVIYSVAVLRSRLEHPRVRAFRDWLLEMARRNRSGPGEIFEKVAAAMGG
jgi:LysR family transcriptional regulator, glycine cleavage system transcriptional activator